MVNKSKTNRCFFGNSSKKFNFAAIFCKQIIRFTYMNNKKIVAPLVAVIALLVAGVAYLGYSLSHEKQVNKDMQELAVLEKQEMENEYQQFADQYSEMKTRINNDSIVAQLGDYSSEEGVGYCTCRIAQLCTAD